MRQRTSLPWIKNKVWNRKDSIVVKGIVGVSECDHLELICIFESIIYLISYESAPTGWLEAHHTEAAKVHLPISTATGCH